MSAEVELVALDAKNVQNYPYTIILCQHIYASRIYKTAAVKKLIVAMSVPTGLYSCNQYLTPGRLSALGAIAQWPIYFCWLAYARCCETGQQKTCPYIKHFEFRFLFV